jgi:hypothetical protein
MGDRLLWVFQSILEHCTAHRLLHLYADSVTSTYAAIFVLSFGPYRGFYLPCLSPAGVFARSL